MVKSVASSTWVVYLLGVQLVWNADVPVPARPCRNPERGRVLWGCSRTSAGFLPPSAISAFPMREQMKKKLMCTNPRGVGSGASATVRVAGNSSQWDERVSSTSLILGCDRSGKLRPHNSRTLNFGTSPFLRLESPPRPSANQVRPPWNFQIIRPNDGT